MRISDWSSDVCSSDLHLTVERCDRAGWHLLEALPDDAERLAHFFDAHHHPIVDIAFGADRHVELNAVVDVIGLRLAQVPGDAGTMHDRAGKEQFKGVFYLFGIA